MKIAELTSFLEEFAPVSYQESYDNSGLLVGDAKAEITQVLISLDSTEDVVNEAINTGCNLIISHHPIIFKGLKRLTGKNYIERTVIKAIQNNIAIYAIHTNLDNVLGGVNCKIAQMLGLQNVKILSPKSDLLKKFIVFIPKTHLEIVSKSLHDAGAGQIGNYKNCGFTVSGIGTFQPNEKAKPFIGTYNQLEKVEEERLEVIFPAYLESKIMAALKHSHPYEEMAYYIQSLDNYNQEVGSGAIGEIDFDGNVSVFYQTLKSVFKLQFLKHTQTTFGAKNKLKIAVCGGSGIFLLSDAIRQSADVFITSDVKYHEFFDAENKITLIDIGHFESEQYTKELLFEVIQNKFTNIAVLLSKTITNPVNYL
jgi:dinuclear metal center YbgI/SA1388 family protein